MAVERTHRPVWQAERCLLCGACTRRCPSRIFEEQRDEPTSLRGRAARVTSTPAGPTPVPACRAACPLGQDVPAYVRALALDDLPRAADIIARSNPLPSVCGRLCLAACMRACLRGALDAPVAIRLLKRAAIDLAGARPAPRPLAKASRVIVVGAGPSGLAAAYFLARRGHQVQVLEAEAEPGGLLRYAIPDFELPREALQRDLRAIASLGVEIVCGRRIGSLAELEVLRESAQAVVLSTGAGQGIPLGIPGEELPGCTDAVAFARGTLPHGAGPAVVAGSGNMAVACARLALRAGYDPVHLVMRRARAESPADPERLGLAEREGVRIAAEVWPVGAFGQGRLERVALAPVVFSASDAVGRRWPRLPSGPGFEVEALLLVAAADRRPDLACLTELRGRRGTLRVSPGLATALPGVFAAGEAVTGGRNAIASIALGLRAAAAVDNYLRGVSP